MKRLGCHIAILWLGVAYVGAPGSTSAQDQPGEFEWHHWRSTAGLARSTPYLPSSRIGDILASLPGVYSASTDGFTRRISLHGRSSFDGPGPAIFVDGRLQPFSLLGLSQLNLIPVSTSEIEHISFSSFAPTGNVLSPRSGRIDISTSQPNHTRVKAVLASSNETGDPGPYRYTTLNTPNVDRSGPTAEVYAFYPSGPWAARLLIRHDDHHVTDELIRNRVGLIYDGKENPRLLQDAADLVLSHSDSSSSQSFQIGLSSMEDYLYRAAIGLELPLLQSWKYFAGQGYVHLPGGPRLEYRVDHRTVRAEGRLTSFPVGIKLQRGHTSAEMGIQFPSDSNTISFRVGATRLRYQDLLSDTIYETGTLPYVSLTGRWMDDRSNHSIESELSGWSSQDRTGPGRQFRMTWSADWTLRDSMKLLMGASYHRVEQPLSLSFLQLVESNVQIPVFQRLFEDVPSSRQQPSVEFGGRLGYAVDVHPRIGISGTVAIRSISNITFARPLVDLSLFSAYAFPTWNVVENVSGSHLMINHALNVSLESGARLALHHTWTGASGPEDGSLKPFFDGTLGHLVNGTAFFPINRRFRVFLNTRIVPGHTWSGFYPDNLATTKRAVLVDAAIQKHLMSSYLLVTLSGHNLANVNYRSHPAGGIENFSLQVKVQLTLEGHDNSKP